MNAQGWVLPLTVLPGIGLFILSTTNYINALSGEIAALFEEEDCDKVLLKKKITQLTVLNTAIIMLYISGALFAVSGLVGGLGKLEHVAADQGVLAMLVLGVTSFLGACICLVTFSIRMLRIKQYQFDKRV